MTKAEQFFYGYAGYSVQQTETKEQGRIRCAEQLAKAEEWFNLQDKYEYSIETDYNADLSWMDNEERNQPHECVIVAIHTAEKAERGHHDYVASIGGVVDADENYLRVLVAELALEVMSANQTSELVIEEQ